MVVVVVMNLVVLDFGGWKLEEGAGLAFGQISLVCISGSQSTNQV